MTGEINKNDFQPVLIILDHFVTFYWSELVTFARYGEMDDVATGEHLTMVLRTL